MIEKLTEKYQYVIKELDDPRFFNILALKIFLDLNITHTDAWSYSDFTDKKELRINEIVDDYYLGQDFYDI